MDNGLIFPYPRRSARDEPRCANHPILVGSFGILLGERGILAGSSQAMG
jgi:hypothetical protein